MENKKPIYILYKKRSLDKKSQYWTQFSIAHRIFLGIKVFLSAAAKINLPLSLGQVRDYQTNIFHVLEFIKM